MAKIGERYDPKYGVDWSDGNSVTDLPRGYYPRTRDGGRNEKIRLRWIDDTPDSPDDNRGHFEVMALGAGYGYFHGVAGGGDGPEGTVAPLEASVAGSASLGARIAKALRINYLIGRE